jgi:hypothetical protein
MDIGVPAPVFFLFADGWRNAIGNLRQRNHRLLRHYHIW